ncbi:MAG: hypothetical protein EB828_00625 [Nitrosopumilus sp. D6]|nr:MAG: hypothetical protein EB828_00625 [Nitrosopumilus sp. D6]
MVKIGLDIGTGFVKCVSDHGSFRFPSLYTRRINGQWTKAVSEAVGDKAARMLKTKGTTAISPICRGRPQKQYQKQVGLLVAEAIGRVYRAVQAPAEKARIVVGLPYEAASCKNALTKLICQESRVESCDVVAQAAGTLVGMRRNTGMVVSIGQGTSEIVVIEDNKILDGRSLEWASEFITHKIGRFAHLDTKLLVQHKDICSRYAKALAENLAIEVIDMASAHGHEQEIIVSGGGILIPRVRQELAGRLKGFNLVVPEDPVMSNAAGLYIMAR